MAFRTPDSCGYGQPETTSHSSKRRSSRRSWFETPPATKFDIAVEKQAALPPNGKNKRRSIDDVETLILTHFTATPRIGFGKVLLGQSKTRTLMVQNPHDYEQEVVVERFPFKKYFNIDQTHFIIAPSEVMSLTLTWTPEEAGSCREMILFHVSDVYRLQAYMFGAAEDSKPAKKKKKGMFGNRLRNQPPMNIVQTSALKSIHDNYSPRKSQEVRELRAQLQHFRDSCREQENLQPLLLDEAMPQTPPLLESTAICRSNERKDQNVMERQTIRLSPSLIKMSPIPTVADTKTMHLLNSYCAGPSDHSSVPQSDKNIKRSPLKLVSAENNQETLAKVTTVTPGENGSQNMLEKIIQQEKRNSSYEKQNIRTDEQTYLSPNSFLNESVCHGKPSTPEIGLVRSSVQVHKMGKVGIVSPNSFLEDLNSTKGQLEVDGKDFPSPSAVLNSSIPHDIMIKQLERIKTTLHKASTPLKTYTQEPVSMLKRRLKDETVEIKKGKKPRQAEQKSKLTAFSGVHVSNPDSSKEKRLHRIIRERTTFAKISDTHSPRRKTFLVSKKQTVKRISPCKGQAVTYPNRNRIQGNVYNNARVNGKQAFSSVAASVNREEFLSTVIHRHQQEQTMHNSIAETTQPPPRTQCEPGKFLPMSKSQRSVWCSPAVAGFTPPVMASRSECDSTSELTSSNVDTPHAADASAVDKPCVVDQGQHTSADHEVITSNHFSGDMTKCATDMNKIENEGSSRHSTGRRLFADISMIEGTLDTSFKPLWAGNSGTVTKDKPSVLPHTEGNSSTSNKKLFPELTSLSESMKIEADPETSSKIKSQPETHRRSSELFTNEIEQRNFVIHSAELPMTKFCFDSSRFLPSSPSAEISRRATLTVTKSRPSEALLDADKLSSKDVLSVENIDMTCKQKVEIVDGEVWKVETLTIERRNSNFPAASPGYDCATLPQLPTLPKPETSRRSSHSVRNPKVLNKDKSVPTHLSSLMVSSEDSTSYDKHDTHTPKEKDQDQPSFMLKSEKTSSCPTQVHHERKAITVVHSESDGAGSKGKGVKSSYSELVSCINKLIIDPVAQASKENENQLPFVDRVESHVIVNRQQIVKKSRFSTGEECCLSDTSKVSGDMSVDSLDAHKHGSESDKDLVLEDKELEEEKEGSILPTDDKRIDTRGGSFVSNSKPPVGKVVDIFDENVRENLNDGGDVYAKSLTGDISQAKPSSSLAMEMPLAQKVDISEESLLQNHSSDKQTLVLSYAAHEKPAVSSACSFVVDFSASAPVPSISKDICKAPQLPKTRSKTAHYTEGQQQTLKSQMHKARSYTGLEASSKKQTVSTSSHVHLSITDAAPTLMNARKGGHIESEIEATKSMKGVRPVSATKSQKKLTKPSAGMSNSANDREGKKPVVAKGIAQSQLILVKKPKNTMPKHPMPFAAKNMYYDERWQDKQERGFVHWLNFILTPPDEYNLANTKMKVDAGSLNLDVASSKSGQHYAPSKEVLSFRAYSARRSLNQLRRASCNLYQSDGVTHVIRRIELEVENRRLAVRTDRMIHADIGIKQRILDMLLMYNPLWLRIGLETAFGEVLPLQSNSDMVGLSRFILTRLLGSPDISAQYAHPTVPHLYQEGFADATARHTLKKFLLLVYFLDQAKRLRLINYDPCLFCKDADIKSSKELLIMFSRDYLSGEGDITKHLAYLGYTVSHVQTPLDEFDYSVKKLCTDLRDGLRLARVIMLLSNNWQCMPSLRGPAISRLQKIHNIGLVFKVLVDKGVDLSTPEGGALNPRDIVDGHREKTLAFLWKLIFHFQTGALLDEEDLREEIGLLERSLKVKLWMQQLLSPHKVAETMARRDSGDPEVATDKPLVKLLLKWCRNVCLHYGVKVENFTVSFSDGRALCCLVHHYHPGLLPLTKIQFQTMQSFQEAAEVSGDQGDSDVSQEWSSGSVFGGDTSPELFEKLLANERENFKILYEKVSELGGIPLMLKASDMSNTIPDERIVMTYVSYLCARLLDLRQEARAARVIQLAWRRFHFHQSLALRQRRLEACLIIQRAFRRYLAKLHRQRQVTAALCIQAAWRVRQKVAIVQKAREDLRYYHAAITVQKNVRTYLAQKCYQRQKQAIKIIQSWFRATWARQQFTRKRRACLLLQHLYRGHKTTMAARISFLRQRQSAVLIQRTFRRKRAMKEEERKKKWEEEARKREQAACLLQSAWRGRRCHQVFIQKIQAVIVLQAWWRMACARSQFIKTLTAVRIIQSQVRAVKIGAKARKEFLDLRHAAVTIQKHWRGHQNQRDYQASRRAAVMIQANFRRFKCAAEYQTLRLAAITIQQTWRAHLARDKARNEYKHMQAACITIQRWIRRKMQHQAARREAASCKIQALWRGYQTRQQLKVMKYVDRQEKAATRIQAWTQACNARREYRKLKKSVLLLQTQIRAVAARRKFKEMQEAWVMTQKQVVLRANFQSVINELLQRWTAATVIQASWRCYQQKRSYEARKTAAVRIQAAFRGHAQRQQFLSLVAAAVTVQQSFRSLRRLRAAIVIQSWWQMCQERKIFLLRKSSAVRLQAAVRRVLVERRYRQLLQVTIFLQRKYRARLLGQAVRLDYQLMVGAAIVIQATWKMHVLRCCYLHLRQNIIKTQACCRRFLVQRQYRRLQGAAVCLQRQYRSKLLTTKTQTAYKTLRAAIIRLQAQVKGRRLHHQFLQTKGACVVLQSATRMWLVQRQYQQQRHATIVIQQRWRAILLASSLRSHYIAMRMAAITLQAAFRGHLVRQSMFNQHQAAAIIQRAFRTHRSREKFLDMKKAALTLQMHFHAFLLGRSQREEFLRIQHACILLQALYRGHTARQHYFAVRLIIVKLQARVRGLQQQKRYTALHDAVIVCQRRYRAKQLGGVFREAFLLIREATIIIQKHVKGLMARRQYQKYHLGATIIQSHIRGWLQRQEYNRQKQAAAVVQSYFRAWREGRRDRDQYLHMRQAALTLQRAWRALHTHRVQRQSFAATVFQKHFRRLTAQREYHQKLSCIVQAQAHVRRYLAWKTYSRKKLAAIKIQKHLRETLLAQRERKEFVQLRKATVVLQSAYRRSSARRNYARVRQHIVLLQAVVRGWLKRRHLQQLRQTVLMLQRKHLANLAARKQRNLFLKQKKAAVYIQETFRAWQGRQINRKIQAAICIQSHIRRFLFRQKFLKIKQSIITLQSYTRRFLVVRVVSAKKAAILTIQQQVRWFLLSRTLHNEVQRRRRAACLIQRAFRKHQRVELDRKLAAVVKIQTEARRWQELQAFEKKKNAVVVLQSAMRGWQGRQQATARRRLLHAVTTVQAAVRAQLAVRSKVEWHQKRLTYLQQVVLAANRHLMVIRIQRWYRRLRLERQAHDHLHAIILLQTWFRTCIERCRFMHAQVQAQLQQEREEQAARVIQRALRKWQKSQEEKRRERLVIKIQATWRGHRLRRSISNRKIASARRRVLEANEAATEEKKLGNRTASALDFLLRYKQLAYILESVMHLDVATRLSPVCCERLVEVNAIGVIYRLILSCNRSLPHMEVIKFCVNILLNLAKYEKTTAAVYEVPESVGTIVELMSIYREKGGAIFTKCCILLAILGREPQRRTEIVAAKKVVEKLQSLHSLVVRKHRMQVNRARAVARTSLNTTLPSHLQAPSSIKMHPDWVLCRDSMQEIEDPLAAISFLLTTLHIGPKPLQMPCC